MKALKEILILELGGIGGSGVQSKDGPSQGHLDPEKEKLRGVLTKEVPARTSPSNQQMKTTQPRPFAVPGVPKMSARPTAIGGKSVPSAARGTMPADLERGAIATPGMSFLPPGMKPEDFDVPPEDLAKPRPTQIVPGKAGRGISRSRTPRQEFDPSKMLSPAELQQAKKQLGLECRLPTLKYIFEMGVFNVS